MQVNDEIGPWFLEIGNDEEDQRVFHSRQEVLDFLDEMKQLKRGAVTGSIEIGPRSWWERALGLGARHVTQRFALEWEKGVAALIFLGDAASEHRATDPSNRVDASEELRRRISHGETTPHPIDECIGTERAWLALRSFIESGERPTWLQYHYVR